MTFMMMMMHRTTNHHYYCWLGIQSFQRVALLLMFALFVLLLLLVPTTRVVQALALTTTTTTTSTPNSLTSTTTSTFISRVEWQDELLTSSQPLVPTPLSRALETLQRDGVVRLDENVRVDPQSCQVLRERILQEITVQQQPQPQPSLLVNTTKGTATTSDLPPHPNDEEEDATTTTTTTTTSQQILPAPCKFYVPGTRLRFRQAMDLAFGGDARHDLLLPLETWPELTRVIQSALGPLEPLLQSAAHALLPRLYGSSSSLSSSSSSDPVELVELASLVVRPGSTHQPFHGDFRRFVVAVDDHNNNEGTEAAAATATNHSSPPAKSDNKNNDDDDNNNNDEEPQEHTLQRQGKLPPRLVTFVALQNVPTQQHGATAFVTGTHTGAAHALVYHDKLGEHYLLQNPQARTELVENPMSTHGVRTTQGFVQGEVLVYDASVLHWGSTNSVPDNHRVMLYFGVSRPGDAALLSCPEIDAMMIEQGGFEQVPPVTLQQVLLQQRHSLDDDDDDKDHSDRDSDRHPDTQ
jgi:hypothetical protein